MSESPNGSTAVRYRKDDYRHHRHHLRPTDNSTLPPPLWAFILRYIRQTTFRLRTSDGVYTTSELTKRSYGIEFKAHSSFDLGRALLITITLPGACPVAAPRKRAPCHHGQTCHQKKLHKTPLRDFNRQDVRQLTFGCPQTMAFQKQAPRHFLETHRGIKVELFLYTEPAIHYAIPMGSRRPIAARKVASKAYTPQCS